MGEFIERSNTIGNGLRKRVVVRKERAPHDKIAKEVAGQSNPLATVAPATVAPAACLAALWRLRASSPAFAWARAGRGTATAAVGDPPVDHWARREEPSGHLHVHHHGGNEREKRPEVNVRQQALVCLVEPLRCATARSTARREPKRRKSQWVGGCVVGNSRRRQRQHRRCQQEVGQLLQLVVLQGRLQSKIEYLSGNRPSQRGCGDAPHSSSGTERARSATPATACTNPGRIQPGVYPMGGRSAETNTWASTK